MRPSGQAGIEIERFIDPVVNRHSAYRRYSIDVRHPSDVIAGATSLRRNSLQIFVFWASTPVMRLQFFMWRSSMERQLAIGAQVAGGKPKLAGHNALAVAPGGQTLMSSLKSKSQMPVIRAFVAAAAGLLALALQPNAARATDLYNDDPPPPRYGNAYEDPRYADLYGHTPKPRPRVESYRPYDPAPIPRERVYRDDERAPHDRRYAEYDRDVPRRSARAGCPSKNEISRMLEGDGWSGFNNPQVLDRDTATIDARRPNGRPYRLHVDRCTGEILTARPMDGQRYGTAPSDRYGAYDDYARRAPRAY